MPELLRRAEPWIGLVDAVGAGLVLLVWYYVRSAAGDRARAVAAALGGAFVAEALFTAFSKVNTFTAWHTGVRAAGYDREVLDTLFLLGGLVVGVAAVAWARGRVAEAAEDLAADAEVPFEDPADAEPDSYTLSRQRVAGLGRWVELLALAVAIALPVLTFRSVPGFFPSPTDADVPILLFHVLSGALTAAPLLVVTARDDLGGGRLFAVAVATVALGMALLPAAPEFFGNELWTSFGTGLALGLLAAVALPLVTDAVTADRTAVVAGVLVAAALLALSTYAVGRLTMRELEEIRGQFGRDAQSQGPTLPGGFP